VETDTILLPSNPSAAPSVARSSGNSGVAGNSNDGQFELQGVSVAYVSRGEWDGGNEEAV